MKRVHHRFADVRGAIFPPPPLIGIKGRRAVRWICAGHRLQTRPASQTIRDGTAIMTAAGVSTSPSTDMLAEAIAYVRPQLALRSLIWRQAGAPTYWRHARETAFARTIAPRLARQRGDDGTATDRLLLLRLSFVGGVSDVAH